MTQAATLPDNPGLEQTIKDEVLRMYESVAEHPEQAYHFFHGADAARRFGYDADDLARLPDGAVASFAGVGNPHLRAGLQPGERVVDVGSGAGMDSIIAGWRVGAHGSVVGIDMNRVMLDRAAAHAAEADAPVEYRFGTMEALPVEDGAADVVISNGVINLSFRKRKAFEEIFRVLGPGGRLSVTDIVSARPLSRSIKEDPNLWAS